MVVFLNLYNLIMLKLVGWGGSRRTGMVLYLFGLNIDCYIEDACISVEFSAFRRPSKGFKVVSSGPSKLGGLGGGL